MGAKLLEINATAITFICEVKKQSTSSVHLSNISDEYVAFKVKTTSPKRFCVRPNSGIISPKSACEFTVTMQGLRSPPSEVECKDKFLIQSTVVDAATKEEDVTLELFSKRSGKYVEEKKLRVVLVGKEDSSSEEHRNEVSGKEPSNKSSVKEENVVKNEKRGKEQSNESSVKEENAMKKEKLGKEQSSESSIKEENAVKNEKLGKEQQNEPSVKKESAVKTKALGKEPSNESSVKEENVVKTKALGKEPSNESSTKEENAVKKDENALQPHTQNEDSREVKDGLTTKNLKASGDLDGNEENLSKNLKSDPVKVVKEDPERKLRLCNQLKELKLKETALENQLKEAKSTISSLTCQNSIMIEAKESLKLELARRSKKGYPFAFVCIVSLIGLISGYISDP
ncbi:vesicle-associated protein 1-2 [Helianthus annuus]|uniref:vesicle-associated protein 1-2 n=1 Tax=Helianthus annuus TaxID=4232 RepID=UPI000B8F3CA5|nr:vesicle-associated protein 1-2 [Helianthus annuus]